MLASSPSSTQLSIICGTLFAHGESLEMRLGGRLVGVAENNGQHTVCMY